MFKDPSRGVRVPSCVQSRAPSPNHTHRGWRTAMDPFPENGNPLSRIVIQKVFIPRASFIAAIEKICACQNTATSKRTDPLPIHCTMEFKVERIVFIVFIFLLLLVLFKLSQHGRNSSTLNKPNDLSYDLNFKKSIDYYRRKDFPKPVVSWFDNHTFNATVPSLQKYQLKPDSGKEREWTLLWIWRCLMFLMLFCRKKLPENQKKKQNSNWCLTDGQTDTSTYKDVARAKISHGKCSCKLSVFVFSVSKKVERRRRKKLWSPQ